jgi:hypothetical protein
MAPVQVHRRVLVIVAVTITFILILLKSLPSNPDYSDTPIHHVDASQSTLHGEVIMPALGNETEKYGYSWAVAHAPKKNLLVYVGKDPGDVLADRYFFQSRARASSVEALPHHNGAVSG